jgi:hypothetical protein
MMTMTKEYGKEYVSLRHRINLLRAKPLYPNFILKESTEKYLEHINKLAKELDMLYSDERYFDELEEKVGKLEESFK